MKEFNIKLLLFMSLFIVLISAVIFVENKLLDNANYFRLEGTKFIVLGHSHPAYAFNDSLINNFSNFGSGGESYFYTYLKTKKIIESNKSLKTVFIEFSNNEILKYTDTTQTWSESYLQIRFPKYLPLMDFSDFRLLWMKNYKGVLTTIPMTLIRNLKQVLIVSLGFRKNIKDQDRFGQYRYLIRDRIDSLINLHYNWVVVKNNFDLAETNISYLTKTIKFCNLKGVKVLLIRCPLHPKDPSLINELKYKEILKTKFAKVDFLDFKDFPLRNSEFGDLEHLNYEGAKKFSIFFNRLLELNLLKNDNKQEFINDQMEMLKKESITCNIQ